MRAPTAAAAPIISMPRASNCQARSNTSPPRLATKMKAPAYTADGLDRQEGKARNSRLMHIQPVSKGMAGVMAPPATGFSHGTQAQSMKNAA